MKYILIILILFSGAASAQVVQETNDSRASRRVIVKNGLLLPKVCNPTTAWPDLLNYNGNKGAIVFDSCNNKIKWWNGSFWDSTGASGGSGDYVDTIYRKAGQDSIFFTINGGAERAIKDSTGAGGGGIPIDSVAVRRIGVHYVGWNSGFNGTGTDGGSDAVANRHNIFIGDSSGLAITSGNRNVAIGPQTLKGNTSGIQNTVIGNNSGNAITTGTENVIIGSSAANTLQSSSDNIAIGNTVGVGISGSGGNISMGVNVGSALTTGASNVGIGSSTLDKLTTGSNNVAIGANALRDNVTQSNNIGIGSRALEVYTGTNGTAVGFASLLTTTGTANVGIGNEAGSGNTTGARNTFIGMHSGVTVNTTGNDNVKIGYRTGASNSTTGSGNTLVGTGAGSNGNTAAAQQNTFIGMNTGGNSGESFTSFLGYESGSNVNGANSSGSYNLGLGYRTMYYNNATARSGSSNTVIGDRIDLPSISSSNQFVWGTNGVNYLTRFTGGGWLINYTTSAVTTQTASTALEVNGTTGAVLFPRLTTTQRDALTATNGMVIYNTTTDKLQVYAAATWVDLH